MQRNSYRPDGHAQNDVRSTSLIRSAWSTNDILLRIGGVCLLLAWDVGWTGSYLLSLISCPIWFVGSVLKSAMERPGWWRTLCEVAIPALTLGMVLANSAVQIKIAEANAPRIIAACEGFQAANGRFPKSLDELVPQYLPSVPRAKYCWAYGEFDYSNYEQPILVWYIVPPYARRIYDFEAPEWRFIE